MCPTRCNYTSIAGFCKTVTSVRRRLPFLDRPIVRASSVFMVDQNKGLIAAFAQFWRFRFWHVCTPPGKKFLIRNFSDNHMLIFQNHNKPQTLVFQGFTPMENNGLEPMTFWFAKHDVSFSYSTCQCWKTRENALKRLFSRLKRLSYFQSFPIKST